MDFSDALIAMKDGHHLAREGWNGKNMYVFLQKGYPEGITCNAQTAEAAGLNVGDLFRCHPYLQMKAVDGSYFMWYPNMLDLLADDWVIV